MSAQLKDECGINNSETQDQPTTTQLKSKLERRRRIEDINDERKLHKELYDY